MGIATLYAPDPGAACRRGVGCGLLPWCAGARRLQTALRDHGFRGRVDLLAIHAERADATRAPRSSLCANLERLDRRDCPGLKLITPSARLRAAAKAHVHRVIASGVMSYNAAFMRRMHVVFWKWELVRLGNEYDAIVFLDLDVDALATTGEGGAAASIAREWSSRVGELVRLARANGPVLVGYAEITTPLNAGMYWVLPPQGPGSKRLYDEGIDALTPSLTPWNATHGFNVSGTPRALFASRPLRHADGSLLRDRRGRVEHITRRGWDHIDGGDLEQGLFLHVLFVRHALGAFIVRDGVHKVRHYVRGRGGKPWARLLAWQDDEHGGGHVKCSWDHLKRAAYLRAALSAREERGSGGWFGGGTSACGRAFAAARRVLDAELDAQGCCERMGWSAPIGHYGGDMVPVF